MKTLVTPPAPDRLMDIRELAARLGIATRTAWKHLASRRLPDPVRIGKAVRFRESDVAEFIANGCEWPDDR